MLTGQYLSFIVWYFLWLKLVILSVFRDFIIKHLITYLAVAKRKVSVCDNAEEKSALTVHV
jgi:hypothetical protein